MTFADKYSLYQGKFMSNTDMFNDSMKRFDGKHNESLKKYDYKNNQFIPGLLYTFDYTNHTDIANLINNKILYYDSKPLILSIYDQKEPNLGLNLNILPQVDRLRLCNILHNNVKIHEFNGNKDPKQCKACFFDRNYINNILKINNIPYIKCDMNYVKNIYALDYSDIIYISNIFFDSVKFPNNMNIRKLHDKIKNIK